jgi:GMP synthase (glutamine-hydrolysing)
MEPMRRGVKVAILQHVAPEGPGLIGDALRTAGVEAELCRVDQGAPVPREAAPYAGLVVMGGPMSAYEADRLSHLRDELRLLEAFLRAGRPVLGVCLGSQLLAAALGARVHPGAQKEIGWIPVELEPARADDPLLAGAPPRLVPLQWHGDVFDLPRGAVRLARSALTEHQAFRHGDAWGLLFHLEATAEQVRRMVAAFPDELRQAGVDGAALIADADARLGALRPVATPVLEAWSRLVASRLG